MTEALPAAFGALFGGSLILVALGLAARRREAVVVSLVRSAGVAPVEEAPPVDQAGGFGRPRLFSILLSAVGAVAGWGVLGFGGVVAGAAGGFVGTRAVARRNAVRAVELLEDQFRDAVVALAAAVRAGLSLRRAIEEVAGDAEPPLRPILEQAVRRLEVGEPLPSVVESMSRALRTPDAPLLGTLLAIHARAGGDLPSMLEDLGSLVGQRRDARRTLRAMTAQGRASGAVLAVLPIAFVTLLSWTGGDGLGDFYRTPAGSALLVAGLTCEGLGFLWIRRLVTPRGTA